MSPSPYLPSEDGSAPPPAHRRTWPEPPYSASGRRTSSESDEFSPRTLRTKGLSSLALGLLLGIAAIAGALYLSRGEYRPEDVLVLLLVCGALLACIPSLITGLALLVAAGVQAGRWHARTQQTPPEHPHQEDPPCA